jgi:hypothetical protein
MQGYFSGGHLVNRHTFTASVFLLALFFSGVASAVPVSEATVEKVCGDKIQGGCTGSTCATGCEKTEGGKIYTYGCTFPNKTGKTKADCHKTPIGRTAPGQGKDVGKKPSVLKAN